MRNDGKETAERYERCVVCKKMVPVQRDREIHSRNYYMEGAGQLCAGCYAELYGWDRKNRRLE